MSGKSVLTWGLARTISRNGLWCDGLHSDGLHRPTVLGGTAPQRLLLAGMGEFSERLMMMTMMHVEGGVGGGPWHCVWWGGP